MNSPDDNTFTLKTQTNNVKRFMTNLNDVLNDTIHKNDFKNELDE